MRILIVALNFKPISGGIAEYTHNIADCLTLTDDVTVLSKEMDGADEFDFSVNYQIERVKYGLSNKIKQWYITYKAIKKIVKEKAIDIIICNTINGHAQVCALAAKSLNIPYCVFTYGLEINRLVKKKVLSFQDKLNIKLSLKWANQVFCVSSFTRNIVKTLGVSSSKTFLLPPGVTDNFLKDYDYENRLEIEKDLNLQDKKVILTLGRLIERKGIDSTIKAVAKIKKQIPNIIYIVGGNGPYRSELEKLVHQYGLENNVIFAGYIPEKDKANYYLLADLFIMPSRELRNGDVEGFGIVFLEANLCAKPVIGGKSGGVVDAIEDKGSGLLVDPEDIDEIAFSIKQLLLNKDYSIQLGEYGKKRAQEEFNWPKITSKMKDIIRLSIKNS